MKRLIKCDVSICHAECCGIVPIPNETVSEFSYLLRDGVKFMPFNESMTICADDKGVCGFLTTDYRCAIYDHRPEICRMFGELGQKHPCLQCSYKRKGNPKKDTFAVEEIKKYAEKLGYS